MQLFVTTMLAGLLGSQGSIPFQGSYSTTPATSHQRPQSDPWSGLFGAKPLQPTPERLSIIVLPPPQAIPALPERHQPERGPCNMPIVTANPNVDPRMIVPIPSDRTNAKIRVIEPAICGHTNPSTAEFIQGVPTRNKIGTQTVTVDGKR